MTKPAVQFHADEILKIRDHTSHNQGAHADGSTSHPQERKNNGRMGKCEGHLLR